MAPTKANDTESAKLQLICLVRGDGSESFLQLSVNFISFEGFHFLPALRFILRTTAAATPASGSRELTHVDTRVLVPFHSLVS